MNVAAFQSTLSNNKNTPTHSANNATERFPQSNSFGCLRCAAARPLALLRTRTAICARISNWTLPRYTPRLARFVSMVERNEFYPRFRHRTVGLTHMFEAGKISGKLLLATERSEKGRKTLILPAISFPPWRHYRTFSVPLSRPWLVVLRKTGAALAAQHANTEFIFRPEEPAFFARNATCNPQREAKKMLLLLSR